MLKIDLNDYQYLTGKKSYVTELPDTAAQVSIKFHASTFVDVLLEGENGEMLPLCTETSHNQTYNLKNCIAVHLQAAEAAAIALCLTAFSRSIEETIDKTPLAVTIASSRPGDITAEIRKAISGILADYQSDVDVDDIDIHGLDGDFHDDELDYQTEYQDLVEDQEQPEPEPANGSQPEPIPEPDPDPAPAPDPDPKNNAPT